MNVGVDYRLATQHQGGMGVYIRNLLSNLNNVDKNNKYILYDNKSEIGQNPSLILKIMGVFYEQYWVQVVLPWRIQANGIDLLFSPNPPAPLFCRVPIVLTIPDMAFFYDKQISFFVRAYLVMTYFLGAHKARVITTFSEASKQDIKRILMVKSEKVIVVPLAASDIFKPGNKNRAREIIKSLGISKKYILSTPGSFVKRKNVEGLLDAYKLLPKSLRNQYQLVVCANTNTIHFEDVQKKAKTLGLERDVVFTGYVEPESNKLVKLYQGAELFVFPSHYEGFGLPPLEAMKCGVPVIVGNNSSLPEVVADAGLKTFGPQGFAEAIHKVLTDKKLYKKMVKEGLKRAMVYSWKTTAMMFCQLALLPTSDHYSLRKD